MKYYVIINGESSLNITGLAIQSLPPISKPLMRSKQETIDGRDGDVITKLGYAAYDKTLKIGLWGNYDLDEIITFFNQEGEIVFSSEPDKYYRFTILNRDDYVNQLEIFKTATIILHCQPYKYLLNEEPKEMENEYITETNVSSATFTNTLEAPMNIDLKGNTLQNGTPTPSSPIPVNNVSGDNQIVVSDGGTDTTTYNIDLPVENKFNKNDVSNGYITYNGGTSPASSWRYSDYIEVKPNTTYTRSGSATPGSNPVYNALYDENKTFISNITCEGSSYTFTTGNTARYIRVTVHNTDLDTYQLEESSKANTYTPYGTTPIELNKIGTYQDYFYKENDKWYLHKEIEKHTITGTESWQDRPNFNDCDRFVLNTTAIPSQTIDGLSNYFIVNRNVVSTIGYLILSQGDQIIINFSTKGTTSLAQFKTWLGNNKPSVYYILSSATNTEITYTPLIEQLNTIEQAQSKEGTTNVNQVNNDLPFMLDLSVFSGSDTLIINNIGNAPSKPVITLVGSGNVGLYLNDIQVFQISLGTNETIILDTENMEAYYGSQLKNRQVIGDYNSFALQSGENTIRFTGSVSYIEITNYTRWI